MANEPDSKEPRQQPLISAQTVIASLLTFLLTVGGALLVFYFTSKAPKLEYEIFPPTHLRDAVETSVYIVRVENSGSKEAENVKVFLKLKDGSTITKMAVTPSMTSLKPTTQGAESACSRSTAFDLLNPGVSCKFSILAENAGSDDIKVEVSAKGITGTERTTGQKTSYGFIATLSMAIVATVTTLLLTSMSWTIMRRERHNRRKVEAISFDRDKKEARLLLDQLLMLFSFADLSKESTQELLGMHSKMTKVLDDFTGTPFLDSEEDKAKFRKIKVALAGIASEIDSRKNR